MKFLAYMSVCVLLSWLPDSLQSSPLNVSDEQGVLIDMLLKNYDRRIRPNSKGSPVNVSVDMFITSFDSIKETTMDYVVTMYFRQHWMDPRLSFNGTETLVVTDNVRDRFWVPDLFFVNVKSAHFHYVTKDNVFFRIEPGGEILYSVRLSLTLSCHMTLENFPMDKQACGIQIEPYGYTTRDLQLQWYHDSAVAWDDQLKMAQYELIGSMIDEHIQDYSTGYFGHVNVVFILIRQLGYYVLQTYIPSILLVVLSWVSFWIDVTAAPARVALGITTVLTLTTQGSGARSELPKVAYAKAIDIWMAACLVFVFAALVEFALVNYLNAMGNDRQNLSNFFRDKPKDNDMDSKDSLSRQTDTSGSNWITKTSSMSDLGISFDQIPRTPPPGAFSDRYRSSKRSRPVSRYKYASALASHSASEGQLGDILFAEGMKLKNRALLIDRLARIGFPLTFAIFNCIYWPLYMIGR